MTVVPGAVCHVLYEDLTWEHDVLDRYDTLPDDAVMGLKVEGVPHAAYEHYFFAPSEQGPIIGFSNDPQTDISLRYPGAKILRGKTTTTRRYHEANVELGRWSPANKRWEPYDGWIKDNIGVRVWTSNKIFDTKGVLPGDWLDWWASLPDDDFQFVMLYENWNGPNGHPQRNFASGGDINFMAPGPDGRFIISSSDDDEATIKTRYPGAVTKRGKFMNVTRLRELQKEVMASVVF